MSTDRAKLEAAIAWLEERDPLSPDRREAQATVITAAEAHLATLPRTKMVEVWHCEWFERGNVHCKSFFERSRAEEWSRGFTDDVRCIRVTGPHFHEVPA